MASLVKKKIGGHLYYYARECQRVDGRPKITWQKYLGSVETIIAAVTERRQGVPLPDPEAQGRVTELGAAAALVAFTVESLGACFATRPGGAGTPPRTVNTTSPSLVVTS